MVSQCHIRAPLIFLKKSLASAGQYVADASIWIAIASFLAVFSIHKALDEHGKEIPVVPKFSTGIAVFVKFLASLTSSLLMLMSVISVIRRHFLVASSHDSTMCLWRH
jgi:hypothetical protein